MEVTDATTSDTVMVRVWVDVDVKVVVEVTDCAHTHATKRESNNAVRPWNCIVYVVVWKKFSSKDF